MTFDLWQGLPELPEEADKRKDLIVVDDVINWAWWFATHKRKADDASGE